MVTFLRNGFLELKYTAFDVDGVVLDIVTPFLQLLYKRYGYNFTESDVTEFDFNSCLGVPNKIIEELLMELTIEPFLLHIRPYTNAEIILNYLSRIEPLLFITSRPSSLPIEILFQNALPTIQNDRYTILAAGSGANKIDYLNKFNRCFLIEDNLDTCILLERHGFRPIVFDQPWNRQESNLVRVRGWVELGELFGIKI